MRIFTESTEIKYFYHPCPTGTFCCGRDDTQELLCVMGPHMKPGAVVVGMELFSPRWFK